uniref:ATP synthase subunit a n=2 Tax=Stichopus TaxID=7691 RepID=A0A7G9M7C1_STIMO|nr:ATP synthase F0 subunit 6 [Stichopus sp. SF-2010]YP_009989806.1 ATP synthase F0 subunit 6 [Stichopus monotuberculatus]ADL59792.1 ATP synthase F0 subunit 6 [Stichopus sp. SF-2010]QNN01408.1 ATP synthase F0 subunit 6 [Stichopus monotuberculatus]
MVTSLFGQFSPDIVAFLPLQVVSSILALSWLLFIFPTNFFSGRVLYIWNTIRLEVMKIIFQNSKKTAAPWIPTLTVVFFIIISINLMGLFPYAFSITSHASFTYSLAVPLWMSVNILGFYLAFNSRLSHLVPQGTPSFLIPIMVLIETLSLIAQPIALGLRLAANLTAGHLLIFLLSTATWILASSPLLSFLTLIILGLLFILEVGVACIQAYVFTSLVNFYLDQNL